jgi:hypothetical protein
VHCDSHTNVTDAEPCVLVCHFCILVRIDSVEAGQKQGDVLSDSHTHGLIMFMATRLRERACLHASCRRAEKTPLLRAPISIADTLKGAASRTARFRADASVVERCSDYQTLWRPPRLLHLDCPRGTRLLLVMVMTRQTPVRRAVDPLQRREKQCHAAPVLEISDSRRPDGFGPFRAGDSNV